VVKARKSDIYVFGRRFGRSLKVSLHEEPTAWRYALTNEHADGRDRRVRQWERPAEFAPGLTQAFAIVVPASEVRPPGLSVTPAETMGVVWIPLPTTGNAVQITVLYAATGTSVSGWPGRRSMGTSFVGMLPLRNGETVWVVAHDFELSEAHARAVAWWRGAQVSRDGTPVTDDLRGALFGHDAATGLRWFVDLSLSQQPLDSYDNHG
jgi:hypothetical protein